VEAQVHTIIPWMMPIVVQAFRPPITLINKVPVVLESEEEEEEEQRSLEH